jgi:hypothetical protein
MLCHSRESGNPEDPRLRVIKGISIYSRKANDFYARYRTRWIPAFAGMTVLGGI